MAGMDALIPPAAGRVRPKRARAVSFCPAGRRAAEEQMPSTRLLRDEEVRRHKSEVSGQSGEDAGSVVSPAKTRDQRSGR